METTPIDPSVSSTASAAAETATSALGREDFLRLLIAKLENQDPLAPQDDMEFVAQLATFSSLEQLISVNDNLQGLAFGQATLVNSQALNLIGKRAVIADAGEIRLRGGQADELGYVLPKQAREATLKLYAADGTLVRTFDLETAAGRRHTLIWDGKDDAGNLVADGTYRVEVSATDAEGAPLALALHRVVQIDGVNFVNGGIGLYSGDLELPFEAILEFRAGA